MPQKILEKMSAELRALLAEKQIDDPVFIGIRTGGVWVANALAQLLGHKGTIDELDINFYRDDFSRIGLNPKVTPSHLSQSVENRHVVLIDDVLGTGRTARAALNEIFDFGRPASVHLVVLIDRNGRELPLSAAVVGEHLKLQTNENIKLRGPDPLRLEILTSKA